MSIDDRSCIKINYKMHVEMCINLFSRVEISDRASPIQGSISIIYKYASLYLLDRKLSFSETCNQFSSPSSPHSIGCDSDETSVESAESFDSESSVSCDKQAVCSDVILQDLIMLTTYGGSAVTQSRLLDGAGRAINVKSMLISLAVQWGVMIMMTRDFIANNDEKSQILSSIECLLNNSLTQEASISIQHDFTRLLTKDIRPHCHGAGSTTAVLFRIQRAVSSVFKSPLISAIRLGLCEDNSNRRTVNLSSDYLRLVTVLCRAAPRHGLIVDSHGQTALATLLSSQEDNKGDKMMSLSLVQILSESCPSALTIADHRGMYPLHLAARNGTAHVLEYLVSRYPHTVPMKTTRGGQSPRYALQYALERSHTIHSEAVIVYMAQVYPSALRFAWQELDLWLTRSVVSPRSFELMTALCRSYNTTSSTPVHTLSPIMRNELLSSSQQQAAVVQVSPRSVVSSAVKQYPPLLIQQQKQRHNNKNKQYNTSGKSKLMTPPCVAADTATNTSLLSVVDSLLALNSATPSSASVESTITALEKKEPPNSSRGSISSNSKRKYHQTDKYDDENKIVGKLVRTLC